MLKNRKFINKRTYCFFFSSRDKPNCLKNQLTKKNQQMVMKIKISNFKQATFPTNALRNSQVFYWVG